MWPFRFYGRSFIVGFVLFLGILWIPSVSTHITDRPFGINWDDWIYHYLPRVWYLLLMLFTPIFEPNAIEVFWDKLISTLGIKRIKLLLRLAVVALIAIIGFEGFYSTGLADAYATQRVWAFFGSVNAELALAWRFREGRDVPQDFSKAAIWFGKAAGAGSAKAQYDLGILHYYGLGVPQNSDFARDLFERSARQQYAPAIIMLGIVSAHDVHNINDAIQFWQQAYHLNDHWSEYLLGLGSLELSTSDEDFYGRTSEQNLANALYWLELARRDGVEPIGGLLQQVWLTVPDQSVERVRLPVKLMASR